MLFQTPYSNYVQDTWAVCGSFETNGSSAPVKVQGLGFTVVRTSTGKFTVSGLREGVLLDVEATLQQATPGTLEAFGQAVSLSSGTAVIEIVDTSTGLVSDLAANANNRVNFILTYSNAGISLAGN